MEQIPLYQVIDGVQSGSDEDHYTAVITEDWMQGRAGFGGLVAAIAVECMRRSIGRERPLRALLTSFIGPAAGEVQIQCKVLRSGKSVTWVEARVLQDGKTCTTFSAAFGGGRESSISVPAQGMPTARPPEDSKLFPYIEGVIPVLTRHFEMRYAFGQFPVSSSKESEIGAWIRFKDGRHFAEPHVVAFMDLLPPAVLQMQSEPKPISSLTWHLEMLDDLEASDARDGDGWWFFHVYAQGAADGYSQQHATLYTPAGRAIAFSQQTISVFA